MELQKRLNESCNSCCDLSVRTTVSLQQLWEHKPDCWTPFPHPFPWGTSHSFSPGQAEDELPVRSPLSQSACCLIALALKMHSLHTVNLGKIIVTCFFFFPQNFWFSGSAPSFREVPHKTGISKPILSVHSCIHMTKCLQKCVKINTCRPALILWHSSLKEHFRNSLCGVLSLSHIKCVVGASNTESTCKTSIPLLYEQLCPQFVFPLCSTLDADINISFFRKRLAIQAILGW